MNGDKAHLRRATLHARDQLTIDQRAAAADALAATLLPRARSARVVAAYVPFGAEPGSAALLDALAVHSTVVVPVTLESRDLDWAAWTGFDDLVPHAGGRLLRPLGPTLGVDYLAAADLILVPAVLVAVSGERLGRGGGYYDRALPRARADAPRVGLLHDGELVDALPADPWDVRLTAVVTPGAGWTDLPA